MRAESSVGPQLVIRLLGSFEVEIAGATVQGLHRREGARLLAYLTLHAGEAIPYLALAKLFWPFEAESNLGISNDYPSTRQAVRTLRVTLGPEAVRLSSPGKGFVRFDLGDADVDVERFDRSVQGDVRAAWSAALPLYRGILLKGWNEPWALEARARRKRSYERVLKLLLVDAQAEEATAEQENCLRRIVESAPEEETYWCALLNLLAGQGRFAEMAESVAALRFHSVTHSRSLEPPTLQLLDVVQRQAQATRPSAALAATVVPGSSTIVRAEVPAERSGNEPQNLPDPAVVIGRRTSLPPEVVAGKRRETVGGAVSLDSRYYILRSTDQAFQEAVSAHDSIVLVKGARQMGKTSLLARGLEEARKAGNRVVLTDFQTFHESQMASPDSLFLAVATGLALQLDLDMSFRSEWDPEFGASTNLEMFLRRRLFQAFSEPLIWGMDEVDRLFSCPFRNEVFGLFRSWHNRRALDPSGPWSRLTLAIAYATEAHLFITDLNQSPFNVGTSLSLQDFTLEQTAELNRRYGSPLSTAEDVERFHRLVGGQPFLAQRGLTEVADGLCDSEALLSEGARESGPFGDHLLRLLNVLLSEGALMASLREVLQGRPCPSREHFYRLRTAGLLVGEWNAGIRLRCPLYQTFLAPRL